MKNTVATFKLNHCLEYKIDFEWMNKSENERNSLQSSSIVLTAVHIDN